MISKLNHIEENGPKDGTVILSDVGFCRWLAFGDRPAAWVVCDPTGYVYTFEVDSCEQAYECSPTFWTPVPSWMKS